MLKGVSDAMTKQTADDLAKTITNAIKKPPKLPIEVETWRVDFTTNIEGAGTNFQTKVGAATDYLAKTLMNGAVNQKTPTVYEGTRDFKSVVADADKANEMAKKQEIFSRNLFTTRGVIPISDTEKNLVKAQSAWTKAFGQSVQLFSQSIGAAAGSKIGGGGEYANAGSSIFSSLATTMTQTLNPFVGGLIGLGAGIIGGFLGGRLDDTTEDLPPVIQENTKAIEANTNALEELGRMVINAPTNYRLPSYTGGQTTGLNIGSININSQTGDPNLIYTQFIDKLNREYSRSVNSGYTRNRILG
jgi:hypothetical protein